MIIQSLVAYHGREQSAGRAVAFGFERRRFKWAVSIGLDGSLLGVEDVTVDGEPIFLSVPRWYPGRTSGIKPSFLSDPAPYIVGAAIDVLANGKLKQWVAHNMMLLADATDPHLAAVRLWLSKWTEDAAHAATANFDVGKHENTAVMVGGTWAHDVDEAADIWKRHLAAERSAEGLCVITGDRGPICMAHKAAAAGNRLISIDGDSSALHHYGHQDAMASPVSVLAEHAYTSALGAIKDAGQTARLGDHIVFYWTDAADVTAVTFADAMAQILSGDSKASAQGEAGKLSDAMDALAAGRVPPGVLPQATYHLLAMRPGKGRTAIVWHLRSTLGDLAHNISAHVTALGLRWVPPVWRLIDAAHHDKQQSRPGMHLDMVRAILSGGRYPDDIAFAILSRLMAGEEMDPIRHGILRAWLIKNHNLPREAIMTSAAFRLGMMLALAEYAQRKAIGDVGVTIAQRHWSAMSTRPHMALAQVLAAVQTYKPTLKRNGNAATLVWIDREIAAAAYELVIPDRMTAVAQAQMALGYYSQKRKREIVAEEATLALAPSTLSSEKDDSSDTDL